MKSQKGSVHIIIVVVLVIALIAALGWVFWQNFIKDDSYNKSEKQGTEKTKDVAKEDTPTLSIKEWGVKIPLSSGSKGAYYKVNESVGGNADNPTNLIVFSDKTDALTGPAGVSCKGEYVAYLLRLPENSEKWQPSKTVDDGKVSPLFTERIVVGEYRYAIATSKQYGPSCFATTKAGNYMADTATSQKFNEVVNAFKADFNNIQAN